MKGGEREKKKKGKNQNSAPDVTVVEGFGIAGIDNERVCSAICDIVVQHTVAGFVAPVVPIQRLPTHTQMYDFNFFFDEYTFSQCSFFFFFSSFSLFHVCVYKPKYIIPKNA